MSAQDSYQTSPTQQFKLTLEIKDVGHIPSFKNRRIAVSAGVMIIQPKIKERMERLTRAFESALLSSYPTVFNATLTGPQLRSWIRSRAPLDDSWDWIPEIVLRGVRVEKGEEGCIVTIEKL